MLAHRRTSFRLSRTSGGLHRYPRLMTAAFFVSTTFPVIVGDFVVPIPDTGVFPDSLCPCPFLLFRRMGLSFLLPCPDCHVVVSIFIALFLVQCPLSVVYCPCWCRVLRWCGYVRDFLRLSYLPFGYLVVFHPFLRFYRVCYSCTVHCLRPQAARSYSLFYFT